MFKKIEIWILYLTIIFSILFAFGFGVLVRQETEGTTKKGKWDISFLSKPAAYIARIPEQFIKEAIGPNANMVSAFRENRSFYGQLGFVGTPNNFESYLLLPRYDGNLKEGVVDLVDLTNFKVIHSWNPDMDAINDMVNQVDEFKYLVRDGNNGRRGLRHTKLTKDFGLLSTLGPLRKFDICSDLIYQKTNDSYHHSIETDIDGNIWAPTEIFPISEGLPKSIVGPNFKDDAIVKLSSDGKILYEKSVAQIFIDNNLEYLLFANGHNHESDPLHLNDIQPVDYDGEYWKKGDVFLSLRNISYVILYRPSTNKIIWIGKGPFLHQHDVDILDEYRISIFNNRSVNVFPDTNIIDGHNEVIIYDFAKDEFLSYFKSSLQTHDVRTVTEGLSEILPNGELFVEETNFGRLLFFDNDSSLQWTYVNSDNGGNTYRVGWSRILYTKEDIKIVNNFLKNKGACD